jgi:hypothetical protein
MAKQESTNPHYQGALAFEAGKNEADNPYPADTADNYSWGVGFRSAMAEHYDQHSCGANSEWAGDEKFCSVCGAKTDERE